MLNIIDELKKYNKIVFGPFLGEFGWEISRWCGFVRWYIKNNKDKKFIISTRNTSEGLYYNLPNITFHLYSISEEYTDKYKPVCYIAEGIVFKQNYNKIINKLKKEYNNYYILDPTTFGHNRNIFSKSYIDFNFEIKEKTKERFINIKKNLNSEKIITLSSRHRNDVNKRNWSLDNWETLLNLFETEFKDYSIITVGKESSIYISKKKRNNIYYLSNILPQEENEIGITMECIKNSNLTVGPQTSIIILSNLLKTPTLFWGHEVKRHAINENYLNTISVGIKEQNKQYKTKPEIIIKNINKILEKKEIK